MIRSFRSTFAALAALLALSAASPSLGQQSDAILDRIKASGAIAIGYRETAAPFSFLDDQQKPVGYSIDLCLRVVEGVRAHLHLPTLSIRWVPVNPQTRIPLVANSTVDIECGSTVNTLE